MLKLRRKILERTHNDTKYDNPAHFYRQHIYTFLLLMTFIYLTVCHADEPQYAGEGKNVMLAHI